MNSYEMEYERKNSFVALIVMIAIPLAVGLIASMLTRNAQIAFVRLAKPPLAPPAWLFPVVWTIMYALMGLASYKIYLSYDAGRNIALTLYGIQLIFNFAWSIIFFRNGTYWFAAAWLLIMWLMILLLIMVTNTFSKIATILLIPYLLWSTFALYLNVGIAILNK